MKGLCSFTGTVERKTGMGTQNGKCYSECPPGYSNISRCYSFVLWWETVSNPHTFSGSSCCHGSLQLFCGEAPRRQYCYIGKCMGSSNSRANSLYLADRNEYVNLKVKCKVVIFRETSLKFLREEVSMRFSTISKRHKVLGEERE